MEKKQISAWISTVSMSTDDAASVLRRIFGYYAAEQKDDMLLQMDGDIPVHINSDSIWIRDGIDKRLPSLEYRHDDEARMAECERLLACCEENPDILRFVFHATTEYINSILPIVGVGARLGIGGIEWDDGCRNEKNKSKSRGKKEKEKKRESIKYCGLSNDDDVMCFVNCIVQQLYFMPVFGNQLRMIVSSVEASPVATSLYELFATMQYGDPPVVDARSFYLEFVRANTEVRKREHYTEDKQQDVSRFIVDLFNLLPSSCQSIITGSMISETWDNEASSSRKKETIFYTIPLSVTSHGLRKSLDDLISIHQSSGIPIMRFSKLPKHLIIHLKRFKYDTNLMKVVKIHDRMEFTTELEIRYQKEVSFASLDFARYSLGGMVIHDGEADDGHYMSYVRDRSKNKLEIENDNNDEWYLMDDEVITRVALEDALEDAYGDGSPSPDISTCNRRSAYVLIYDRLEEEAVDISMNSDIENGKAKERSVERVDTRIYNCIARQNRRRWCLQYGLDRCFLTFVNLLTRIRSSDPTSSSCSIVNDVNERIELSWTLMNCKKAMENVQSNRLGIHQHLWYTWAMRLLVDCNVFNIPSLKRHYFEHVAQLSIKLVTSKRHVAAKLAPFIKRILCLDDFENNLIAELDKYLQNLISTVDIVVSNNTNTNTDLHVNLMRLVLLVRGLSCEVIVLTRICGHIKMMVQQLNCHTEAESGSGGHCLWDTHVYAMLAKLPYLWRTSHTVRRFCHENATFGLFVAWLRACKQAKLVPRRTRDVDELADCLESFIYWQQESEGGEPSEFRLTKELQDSCYGYDSDEELHILVGRRVTIQWANKKWYNGTVSEYCAADEDEEIEESTQKQKQKSHMVMYDDGEMKCYDMGRKENWRFI
jgi:ubiquitin C-terminal hydrolase